MKKGIIMENTQVVRLIASFSGQERREIRKFLQSPYFNVRQDVVLLFDYLSQNPHPDKKALKSSVWGNRESSDQELRLVMTYLMRLLEQFIAQKEFTTSAVVQHLWVAAGMRKRGLGDLFEKQKRWLLNKLEDQPLRDSQYHEHLFQVHWETHQWVSSARPTYTDHLQAASVSADIAYIAQKLRLICLSAAQQTVYASGINNAWEAEVVSFAEQHYAQDIKVIAIYLHCYKMLRNPEDELHFEAFKTLLLDSQAYFSQEENRSFFLWAINYCIKQINGGRREYFLKVNDLYKPGIEQGFLLENNEISTYTYYNIVAAGLQTNDLEWVRFFIYQYRNHLQKQDRERAFSFNLARLEYAQKDYKQVLELLQKVNYRDPLVNLAAKTILLKTWYDLGEQETLQSHLDAMRNYIHRKRVLGYHRINYLNIIRYTDKLLNLNWLNKSESDKLKEAIQQEETLTEREWLLEKF